MRRVICGIILASILGGCMRQVPMKVDTSIVDEISKEMSIDYLNDLPKTADYTSKYPSSGNNFCKFRKEGIVNSKTRYHEIW